MSAVGRSCAKTIKRSRQNVAIATQVLSPSAIGGSLRGQRRLKHFGPPDDDEEEFIAYRRRAAWKKLAYYGLAIVVTILILMGIVLAIGYWQTSNKSNSMAVSSRSIKLIQEGKPFSYIYTSKTTPDPPSAHPTDSHEFSPTSHSSFLRSYTKGDSLERVIDNQNEELYFPASGESESTASEDDYLLGYNLERGKSDNNDVESDSSKENIDKEPIQPLLVNSYSFHIDHDDDDDRDHEHETDSKSNDKLDNDVDVAIIEKESVHNDANNDNDDWESKSIIETNADTQDQTKEKNEEELPTKEKFLPPPQDSSVFSLEIPIYANNKTSVTFVEKSDPNEHLVSVDVDIKNENRTKDATPDEISEKTIIDNKETIGSIRVDSDASASKLLDNETFQQALLHTALFHLDEDNRQVKAKPVATAIIIEDQDYEDSTAFSENHYSDLSFPSRPRNHKVKILKNDKVMNMKATYTPGRVQSSRMRNRLPEIVSEKKSDDVNVGAQKQISRARNWNNASGEKNKTNEWKLRLRVNKEEKPKSNLENMTDVSLDGIHVYAHPDSSSLNEQAKNVSEGKPRLLSASSLLPSFESFLKTILSNVQSTKKGMFHQESPLHQGASEFGNSYTNNLDHFLPSSTLPSPTVELDPTQLRKRTFISEHDIFAFPSPIQAASQPQPENYFDHLLGQIPTVGLIGSPTATGASFLSNYQTPIFPTSPTIPNVSPYEINHSSTNNDAVQLAPGIVPLDLASTFIPAGLQNPKQSGHQSQPTPYGTNFYDNFPSISSYPYSNPYPKADGNIGTVTTSAGQPPTYNSISQGMHLLNMISGTIPSTYYHDQVYHSSQSTPPTFQNDALASFPFTNPTASTNFATASKILVGKPYDFLNSLPNINSPASPPPPPPPQPSHLPAPFPTLTSFDYQSDESNHGHVVGSVAQRQSAFNSPLISRGYALKSDRDTVEKFLEEEEDNDNDQLPSASSTFSQSILTTFKKPKAIKKSTTPEQTTTAGSIISLMTKPRSRTTSMFKAPTKPPSSPKSFSFEILPQRNETSHHNHLNPSANTVIFDGDNVLNLSNEDMYPPFDHAAISRSKKKSGVNLIKPWKTFNTTTKGHRHNGGGTASPTVIAPSKKSSLNTLDSKNLYKKIKKTANVAGLKSGFFTYG